jgi:tetratricopeptide (TPR) repeat protein
MTRLWIAGLLCAALGACASAPPAAEAPLPPPSPRQPEGVRAFEAQQRERALALEQQGAWLDAAAAWEVLSLLNPGDYGPRLAAVQERIDEKAQEHLARARQDYKRGDVASAEQFYLGVIALQPRNKEATEALKGIERVRNRQEHLLKAGRTLPPPETGKRPAAPPVASNPLLMEQASNLANQGDFDEAIELMAGQFKANPNDSAARDLMADLLYKKALSMQAKDPAGAQAALKRCLQVSPHHTACKAPLNTPAPKKPLSPAAP